MNEEVQEARFELVMDIHQFVYDYIIEQAVKDFSLPCEEIEISDKRLEVALDRSQE